MSCAGVSESQGLFQQSAEEYYEHEDSEHDNNDYQPDDDDDLEDQTYTGDMVKETMVQYNQDNAIDGYITKFNDSMSKEDFNSGREYIYDLVDRGIDDTDMTKVIDQECIENNTLIADQGFFPLMVFEGGVGCEDTRYIEASKPGNSGCTGQEISQEISHKHIEEVSLGYKKR